MKKEAACWNLLFHIQVGGGMIELTTAVLAVLIREDKWTFLALIQGI